MEEQVLTEIELVRIGTAEFFVEVADGSGPRTVGLSEALSFDRVRQTVEAVGGEFIKAIEKVSPSEASVEFGLSLTAKTGQLTGLLVQGDGAANVTFRLIWRRPTAGT